jgi:PucR family transcriptional regulator, purine catabolism regulatory protein
MSLLVHEILQLDILQNAKVITGKEYVKERAVQWVSAIEMPVENFVRKNEFVLTTAIGCGQNPKEFEKFVQDIIDSGASALVLALGRHIYDIPDKIIENAEINQFIIIEIPWEIRFSNIIEEIMLKLNAVHFKEIKKSEKVQQDLLNLILKEEGLDSISNYLYERLEFPVIISDMKGAIQAKSKKVPCLEESWKRYIIDGIIPSRDTPPLSSQDPMVQKIQIVNIEEHCILQLPVIQVSGNIQDYLFVLLPADITLESFLTPFILNVLEHAVTTLAIWFSRKNAADETKLMLRASFINELINGEFNSWDQADSRAGIIGYNLDLPYVCIIGSPENLKDLFKKRKLEKERFQQWSESMIHYIKEEIFYAAQSLKKEMMITYQDERLVIFLEISLDKQKESVLDLLDLVDRRLKTLLPKVIISWGIGDYKNEISGFKESYQNAKIALNISRYKKGIGNRVMYENTRIDRLLLNLFQNSDMKEIIMSTVEPLLKYNKQRKIDLIDTLSTYTHYQGNVSQTARALFLHRQSLLYRLRKIEELTELSLVEPDDLFLLDLSIKTWKIGSQY